MTGQERTEMGELDHGKIAEVTDSPSVENRSSEVITIDGIEVPPGWELLAAGEVRKVRKNPAFIDEGVHLPAWKVEDSKGGIVLAFEVRIFHPPELKSAKNPNGWRGNCGMAWVETSGPILIRQSRV